MTPEKVLAALQEREQNKEQRIKNRE